MNVSLKVKLHQYESFQIYTEALGNAMTTVFHMKVLFFYILICYIEVNFISFTNMDFKLPIQCIDHELVEQHVIDDLELVKSDNKPICDIVFCPKTPESKELAKEWMKYYTTNTLFLKESASVYKQTFNQVKTKLFMQYWKEMHDNKEFDISFHYIESKWFKHLNTSPTVLQLISLYFLTSPVLFLISPVLIVLLPFIYIKLKGDIISWESYMTIFKSIIRNHSLCGLFFKFGESDAKQRIGLIGSAAFFIFQLYANVYNFITFYKNINYIHTVLITTKEFMTKTVQLMKSVQTSLQPLSTYTLFMNTIPSHQHVLEDFIQRSSSLSFSIKQCGTMRALFYELYSNETMKKTIEYTIKFHGFIQNISGLKQKKLSPCTFGKVTTLHKSYFPTKHPVKNNYSVMNTIITGPNASGKTTLIKSTMINLLLSQQIGCGFYKKAVICPYEKFFSYLNIPDTSNRDSLFQAEARRCKEIIDEVNTGKRIFCIFDELFSGTNPKEACSSAKALLTFLSSQPNFTFLLTTHFIDICESLSSIIRMKHMKVDEGNELKYLYILADGISYAKGGVKVLEQLHFPESIIKNAKLCG